MIEPAMCYHCFSGSKYLFIINHVNECLIFVDYIPIIVNKAVDTPKNNTNRMFQCCLRYPASTNAIGNRAIVRYTFACVNVSDVNMPIDPNMKYPISNINATPNVLIPNEVPPNKDNIPNSNDSVNVVTIVCFSSLIEHN